MKKVIVAKSAGFCWGVSRAFDKVMEIVKTKKDDSNVFTYGPLIHNPQAVEMLKEMGVDVLDDMPQKICGTVFIRTHGLSPAEREQLKKSGAKICDATCPDVGIIQGIVRKYVRKGYNVIIVGNSEHPEVRAILGYAEGKGVAVLSSKEIEKLPKNLEKVCVVAQSTQKEETFEKLVQLIKSKFPKAEIFNTICSSTTERQEEVRSLAKEVDAMVVVGGYNSANTTKLAQISREIGALTFHIETEKELNPNDFKDFSVIGVTAGSSTPNWLIERVVKRLSSF
ncbi:MAG: 4-hydroxy-3-methylbut-2-enyl diphosphate reductase [Deltaproteobacteria bacterium]|nr:4-hydroxy-3-methylbut-2-enyl diphosphate reductase [Deltaproteobacteria bacterium]